MKLYNRRDPIHGVRQGNPRKHSKRLWTPPGTSGPAAPTNVLLDNFTGADGTAQTAHTSDDGKTWTNVTNWAAAGVITGNKLHGNGTGAAMKASTADVADVDITCQIYFASAVHGEVCGAACRIAAAANTLMIGAILCWSGVWSSTIRRYITDGYAEYISSGLGGAAQPAAGSTHALRFVALGAAYSLYYDGLLAASASNAEISAAGKVGTVTGPSTATTGMLIDSIVAT